MKPFSILACHFSCLNMCYYTKIWSPQFLDEDLF